MLLVQMVYGVLRLFGRELFAVFADRMGGASPPLRLG